MKNSSRTLLGAFTIALLILSAANPVAGEDEAAALSSGNIANLLRLTRSAANRGDAKAQYRLGLLYSNGREGVGQNRLEAVKWYRRAAEQGDHEAQASLADAYFNGFGVPQDYIEAHKWANLAISRAPDDVTRSAHLVMLETISQKLSRKQIAEAQKLARDWKPKAER
jgi:uncharacterized protein